MTEEDLMLIIKFIEETMKSAYTPVEKIDMILRAFREAGIIESVVD